ncbi:MAG: M56 family metallopeptidase [Pseudomonadota bacterium]
MTGSVSENLIFVGQTSLAVTVLIGLVLLVRRPFAMHFGAKAAYALWAIPAARLILPPLPEGWSLFSPLSQPANVAVAEAPTAAMLPSGGAAIGTPMQHGTETLAATPLGNMPMPVTSAAPSSWVSDALASFAPGMAMLAIWLVGAAGYLAWTIYRQTVFSRIVAAEGQAASPAVLTRAMEICQSIGFDHRKVSIQTSFISDSPFVTGLFRPVVVLPAWFELDYSAEERDVALMHELMHVKRRDLFALQASTVFLALQWFNPLVHFAMSAFRSDQEASCDADVIGIGCSTPHAYGATLVKAVRKCRPSTSAPAMRASLTLTHSLAERLKQLRNPLPTVRRRMVGTVLTAAIGSVALIASACTTASAHPHDLGDELDGAPQPPAPEAAIRPEAAPVPSKPRIVVRHRGHGAHIILLNNPMDEVEFEIEAIEGLSSLMEEEALQMETLIEQNVSAIAGDVVAAMADVATDLNIRIESGELRLDMNEADIRASGDIMAFVGDIMARAASGEISEAEIDALTDDFEDRIEIWTDDIEARVEAMEPILEARVEAYRDRWSEKIEARIEAHSDAIERHSEIIESHAGRIEEAGELIGDLADECTDGEGPRIVSRISNSTGKRYKAVCLDPASAMTKDEVMSELRATGQLTEAELDKVCRRFDEADNYAFEWEFTED